MAFRDGEVLFLFPDLGQGRCLGQFHQAVVEAGFKDGDFFQQIGFRPNQAHDIPRRVHHGLELGLAVGHIAVGVFLVLVGRRVEDHEMVVHVMI